MQRVLLNIDMLQCTTALEPLRKFQNRKSLIIHRRPELHRRQRQRICIRTYFFKPN